ECLKALWRGGQNCGLFGGRVRGAMRERIEAVYGRGAAEFHEFDRFGVTALEAHCRARRNIQTHAKGLSPVESERAIHCKKMKMGAYLNRTISAIGHLDLHEEASRVCGHRRFC